MNSANEKSKKKGKKEKKVSKDYLYYQKAKNEMIPANVKQRK